MFGFIATALCQPEVMGWGNMTGIRVDGQLMEFETSLCVVEPDWSASTCTIKERQRSKYERNGKIQTVEIQLLPRPEYPGQILPDWSMSIVETVEGTGVGSARMNVEFAAQNDADIAGAYLRINLPASFYSGGRAEMVNPDPSSPEEVSLVAGVDEQNEYLRAAGAGARFLSTDRQLEILFNEPTEIIIRDDRRHGNYDLHVYMAVMPGKVVAGQTAGKGFSFTAKGEIDREPVELELDPSNPGQVFDGLGGNFRVQNPNTDPAVIRYNLDGMRVAWGRVEMPWYAWDPTEDSDPLEIARAGKLNTRVDQAMEMARKLAQRGMPVIVSAWFGPSWAILGKPNFRTQPGEPRGNPLNPEKMGRIAESITSYLIFLKERYGVEAVMFSFNESDLGINIRQTAREHAELIKTLGKHFAANGLSTRLLLGDTSDANPIDFIKPTMRDLEAVRYIGAVSFHSWRGCTDEKLNQWRAAARQLNVPLLIGEGSTDAEAWNYPQIFRESSFALHEIDLYTRILAVGQPRSILQWQLTADYSILFGGGVFGEEGLLQPTQRFWNLKQLASTPAGAFALPIKCKAPGITSAAFGDIANGIYALHIVNNGAARHATITGLPPEVKSLKSWITDNQRGMQESSDILVSEGKAEFTLDATSFMTLMNDH